VKENLEADGKVTFEFDVDRNSSLAANLKGRLMLTTGDIDNNVHHAGTYRMAHALIQASPGR
jgi:dipeptidyl-peptidase-4